MNHDTSSDTAVTPTTSPVPFDSIHADQAIEVAPRIWWVGAVLDNDPFQCHAYLIEAGTNSVLVDPGSSLTIDATIAKIEQVVPLDHVATLLIHHSDPDCSDALHRLAPLLDHDRTRILTEWRSEMLLRHLDPPFDFITTEDLGWRLDLDHDRRLQFVLTPYLHFPGAFVTYDTTTGALLTSDLFGGFNRQRRLYATNTADFDDLRSFHQHYMPSRDILMAGLTRLRQRVGHITTVLPQHGYVIPEPLVDPLFDELLRLDCGVLLMSREDAHLSRLIDAAGAVRHIEDLLDQDWPLADLIDRITHELRVLLDITDLAVERSTADHTSRYDRTHPDGIDQPATQPGPRTILWPLGDDGHQRTLTAVIDHHDNEEPIEDDVVMLLNAVTEHARHTLATRLDILDATHDAERWQRDAHHDALTGLLNRHALATHHPTPDTAVILIDLDHFKHVNDTYGHDAGDAVLQRTANTINTTIREPDIAIRYGGEELLVLATLPDHDHINHATHIADRLRTNIEHLDLTDIHPDLTITASIGIAITTPHETLDDTIHRADTALYNSKTTGRNRTTLAPPDIEN